MFCNGQIFWEKCLSEKKVSVKSCWALKVLFADQFVCGFGALNEEKKLLS